MGIFAVLDCILVVSDVDIFCGLVPELLAGGVCMEFCQALDAGSGNLEQFEAFRSRNAAPSIPPDAVARLVQGPLSSSSLHLVMYLICQQKMPAQAPLLAVGGTRTLFKGLINTESLLNSLDWFLWCITGICGMPFRFGYSACDLLRPLGAPLPLRFAQWQNKRHKLAPHSKILLMTSHCCSALKQSHKFLQKIQASSIRSLGCQNMCHLWHS